MSGLRLEFAKGHGTGNDFVILPDPEGQLGLTDAVVRRLTDRHVGIGGDGLLRVVPTRLADEPEVRALADSAPWFMDYRNADGSKAEMCGNGVRVFAEYLVRKGWASGDFAVATRAGVRQVRSVEGGYEVAMGMATEVAAPGLVSEAAGQSWPAVAVFLPNPHAVAFVDSVTAAGPLLEQPTAKPSEVFPAGANFEFVEVLGERHVRMRVHERGVGETLSCGTGACAVAYAARQRAEVPVSEETVWRVDVPGGTVLVTQRADGELLLSGPAVIVAEGWLEVEADV